MHQERPFAAVAPVNGCNNRLCRSAVRSHLLSTLLAAAACRQLEPGALRARAATVVDLP